MARIVDCVAQAVARIMVAAGTGSIVNLSSQAGQAALPKRTVYCATKFAIEGMTEAMAYDLRGTGVRVSTLAPALVETPMTKPFLAQPAFRAYVNEQLLLSRFATPEGVAAAAVFPASPASDMTTDAESRGSGGKTPLSRDGRTRRYGHP